MCYVVQPINGYFRGHEDPSVASLGGQPAWLASADFDGSFASAGAPALFYKSSEQFQDPALRKKIGEMANAFDGEKMKREAQVIIERESRYRGRRGEGKRS